MPGLVRRVSGVLRPPRRPGCTSDTVRCDFWNWGPDAVRPSCCTEHLTELAVFVHELLERNGIVHWIDYGGLLGAVRGQALIPWDTDVDFGMLEEDVERVLALEPEVIAAGHVLDLSDPATVRVQFSRLNDQHVDLFRWRNENGVLHADTGADWPGMHNRESFPKSYIERLDPVEIGGRRFPAPAPVHEFLVDHRYGPDYMVPARLPIAVWLYPRFEPDEMTPAVRRLLSALAERDHRLAELNYRSRLSRMRAWRAWRNAARPLAPSTEDLERAGRGIAAGELTDKVDRLVYAVASFDRAIDELEHPRLTDPVRRSYRRAVRIGQAAKARLTGTRRSAFGER